MGKKITLHLEIELTCEADISKGCDEVPANMDGPGSPEEPFEIDLTSAIFRGVELMEVLSSDEKYQLEELYLEEV